MTRKKLDVDSDEAVTIGGGTGWRGDDEAAALGASYRGAPVSATVKDQRIALLLLVIDVLDAAIICCIALRLKLARRIGWYKRQAGVAITDGKRETAVFRRARKVASLFGGQSLAGTVDEIFRLLVEAAKDEQYAPGIPGVKGREEDERG